MTKVKEPIVAQVIEGIRNVKGHEIAVLDLHKIDHSIANYFVLCTGDSPVQVNAISESIQKEIEIKSGESPVHVDGKQNRQWIILDYTDVVVHIFLKEWRDFYKLEELWGDAAIKQYED
jgi:ribosome-associated protein